MRTLVLGLCLALVACNADPSSSAGAISAPKSMLDNKALDAKITGATKAELGAANKIVAPDMVQKIVAPDMVQKIVAPDMVQKIVAPDMIQKRVAPDEAQKIVAPDMIQKYPIDPVGPGPNPDPG